MAFIGNSNHINIARSILGEIGLALRTNYHVYDQDTMNDIQVNGKPMVFSFAIDKPFFFNEKENVLFDPFGNYTMMNQLFAYYITKGEESGELSGTPMYYQEKHDQDPDMVRLVLRAGQEVYMSEFYHNKCLPFCDLILKMGYPMEYITGQYSMKEYDIVER